ncbi:hypothetical protein AsAng_0063250 [Aureispira anguillae]|uniref:Uncharacterized protein n=1 Tax=Aureispira anguillae TaxID=2864201 RepID=A0A915YM80_9BACT|nr:hypothetical protein AsAng_0063250 [Aureispira anguillae]
MIYNHSGSILFLEIKPPDNEISPSVLIGTTILWQRKKPNPQG